MPTEKRIETVRERLFALKTRNIAHSGKLITIGPSLVVSVRTPALRTS
ncbi:MAG: hypothetical protein ACLT98_14265 [Eggerthellaceae bacterium]